MSGNAPYWVTTAVLASDSVLGGVWDVLRVPQVHVGIDRLGYPTDHLIISVPLAARRVVLQLPLHQDSAKARPTNA
jgi:hypothetical protein